MKLRLARNKDASQIISLIKKCYLDYPNCYLDVKNDSPELMTVFTYFKEKNGKFWVYETNSKVIGCMGYLPMNQKYIEIHKLYIDKKYRNKGLAKKLILKVENIAVKNDFKYISLWTDTRFKEAHEMYRKLNYKKSKKTRKLYDISNTSEYNFKKKLIKYS